MAKTSGKSHTYQGDPLYTQATKQAPQETTGANKATKGTGKPNSKPNKGMK